MHPQPACRHTCGSITYSDGIHDDVNKFVWGDQDWDPSTPVADTLRDYCRLFINSAVCDELAQGLLAEERNWQGPLAVNAQVNVTLRQWQQLEQAATPAMLTNYRFQMGLLRAYYDAYIKRRLIHETELEAQALDALRTATPAAGGCAGRDGPGPGVSPAGWNRSPSPSITSKSAWLSRSGSTRASGLAVHDEASPGL